jgi:uncharacterized protein
MILVDANLLLYAYDDRSPHHRAAAAWLERALSSGEHVAFTWQVLLAFLRIMTDIRLHRTELDFSKVAEVVSELLQRDEVVVLEAGERHWEILRDLIVSSGSRGATIMDANLAAIAIEHGATLYSSDRDFARFKQLHWINPLSS